MITLYGDWDKLLNKMQKLTKYLVPQAKAKLYEDGKIVVEMLQSHIDNQDLPWPSLSEVTLKQKEIHDIYIETGELRDNFCVNEVRSSGNDVKYFVGVSPSKVHKESGLKYTELLMYMEYGTVTQPSRPIIAPTSKEVQTRFKKEWKDFLTKEMRE